MNVNWSLFQNLPKPATKEETDLLAYFIRHIGLHADYPTRRVWMFDKSANTMTNSSRLGDWVRIGIQGLFSMGWHALRDEYTIEGIVFYNTNGELVHHTLSLPYSQMDIPMFKKIDRIFQTKQCPEMVYICKELEANRFWDTGSRSSYSASDIAGRLRGEIQPYLDAAKGEVYFLANGCSGFTTSNLPDIIGTGIGAFYPQEITALRDTMVVRGLVYEDGSCTCFEPINYPLGELSDAELDYYVQVVRNKSGKRARVILQPRFSMDIGFGIKSNQNVLSRKGIRIEAAACEAGDTQEFLMPLPGYEGLGAMTKANRNLWRLLMMHTCFCCTRNGRYLVRNKDITEELLQAVRRKADTDIQNVSIRQWKDIDVSDGVIHAVYRNGSSSVERIDVNSKIKTADIHNLMELLGLSRDTLDRDFRPNYKVLRQLQESAKAIAIRKAQIHEEHMAAQERRMRDRAHYRECVKSAMMYETDYEYDFTDAEVERYVEYGYLNKGLY